MLQVSCNMFKFLISFIVFFLSTRLSRCDCEEWDVEFGKKTFVENMFHTIFPNSLRFPGCGGTNLQNDVPVPVNILAVAIWTLLFTCLLLLALLVHNKRIKIEIQQVFCHKPQTVPSPDDRDMSFNCPPRARWSIAHQSKEDTPAGFEEEHLNDLDSFVPLADNLFLDGVTMVDWETEGELPAYLPDEEFENTSLFASVLDSTFNVSDIQKNMTFYGNDMVSVYQFASVIVAKKLWDGARSSIRNRNHVS